MRISDWSSDVCSSDLLVAPLGAALAMAGAAQALALQLHQPLGRKADHLAQECRIGALLQKRAKGDLVIGHRGGPRVRVACRSEERRVGTGCVGTWRSWWSPYH